MPEKFEAAQHVFADFGEGRVVAHLVTGQPKQVDGDTKYAVQDPNGDIQMLTYREPGDRDAGGSGRTFWLTPDSD
jgi:hypothetical protein